MISDRQKGLGNALGSVFEGAEIRFCVRHLHSNLKKEFPGLLLKQKLWACARAATPEDFKKKMASLKEVIEKAYNLLMKKNPRKRVREAIEKNKHVARHFQSTRADSHKIQVHFRDSEWFFVNLMDRVCTCKGYQLTGIPCGHALAAIWSSNLNVMDFVDSAYKKEAFIALYAGIIEPMPSPHKWPDPGHNPISPPTENVLPGRPKKSRKREPDEPPAPNATKARRVGQANFCSSCGKQGHSRRTCKSQPTEHPVQQRRMGRPPKKNPTPETIKRMKRRVRQKAREAAQASSSQPHPQTTEHP
ncbi:uncharacterized protein LOC133815468 [Humulus lupulus]|uniref:uncharacterized protein LOC133815468 n=1 Tax=Humulus lupulus TaxID=3486 RepID=UPI002B40196E|nr:uncharacterized protein LOC133815468 [Humulus lupulus]